jgi:hypothetical protein
MRPGVGERIGGLETRANYRLSCDPRLPAAAAPRGRTSGLEESGVAPRSRRRPGFRKRRLDVCEERPSPRLDIRLSAGVTAPKPPSFGILRQDGGIAKQLVKGRAKLVAQVGERMSPLRGAFTILPVLTRGGDPSCPGDAAVRWAWCRSRRSRRRGPWRDLRPWRAR